MSETPKKRARTSSVKECRACLTKIYDESCCVDMFRAWDPTSPGVGVSIAEDLSKLTNIQINVSDPYSKIICQKCCTQLQDAINFTWSVQNNDRVLKKRHKECTNENPLWPKPIQVDKCIESNALSEMAVEVKQEVLTDDEYEMNETFSERSEPKLDIKIEPEEITPASPSIMIEVNGPFSLSQPPENKTNTNGETEFLEESLLGDMKEEPMSEDETEPSTDLPKDCMLCLKTFNTVQGLKAHVIAVHSYDTVTSLRVDRANVCATCNRSFATRTDLFVHETCHSKFACYVCDKKFDTFLLLTKHRNKQCMKTSILPRLKTLEDVRRPDPVYYIFDKKPPSQTLPETKNFTPELPKEPSPITEPIESKPSLVETNPVLEEPEDILYYVAVDQQLQPSKEQTPSINESKRVEELLSECNEEIHLQESTEKVSDKQEQPHESKVSEKSAIEETNKLSKDNQEEQQTTPEKETIDVNVVMDSRICNKVKDNINNKTVTSPSSIDIDTEITKVNDEIKQNGSDVSSTYKENEPVGQAFEKLSEFSNIIEDNEEVKSQEVLNDLKNATKDDTLDSEENIIKADIILSLDACTDDKTQNSFDKMDVDIKSNEIENIGQLLPKLDNLGGIPNEDSMEIKLKIHSVDKDDSMEIEHDLEGRINNC